MSNQDESQDSSVNGEQPVQQQVQQAEQVQPAQKPGATIGEVVSDNLQSAFTALAQTRIRYAVLNALENPSNPGSRVVVILVENLPRFIEVTRAVHVKDYLYTIRGTQFAIIEAANCDMFSDGIVNAILTRPVRNGYGVAQAPSDIRSHFLCMMAIEKSGIQNPVRMIALSASRNVLGDPPGRSVIDFLAKVDML